MSELPVPQIIRKSYTRRGLLGMLGAAGASLIAAPKASAFIPLLPSLNLNEADRHSMPLTETLLPGAEAYGAFLSSLNLRHIDIPLVLESHAKQHHGVKNTLPPTELWSNLVGALRVADAICSRMQQDVLLIASAYRTCAYNALCPGSAKNSQHLQNGALDLIFRADPADVAQVARDLRNNGLFHGGIGQYQNFTHVDTRGENVDWQG
jgi:hypothetical protein